jgi:hypothetical protein
MKRIALFLCAAFSLLCMTAALAGQSNWTGHDSVSVSSAVTITEVEAVRFGNFSVFSPGGGDAYIVLNHTGARTSTNGASTQIVLLYGASNGGITNAGSQGPGHYLVSHAGASTNMYVSFTDNTGTTVAACPSGNSIYLNGPVGSGQFCVDAFTFNASGSDGGGSYITTDGSGNATVRVGATLHTVAGVTSYAPGTYRGTFEVQISY